MRSKLTLLWLFVLWIATTSQVKAQCVTTPSFGPSAIVESFEGIAQSGLEVPQIPIAFTSGVIMTTPSPNDYSGVVLIDFAKGGALFGLCNSTIYSADIPHGTAYLGQNNNNTSRFMTFVLPQPASKVGVNVEGATCASVTLITLTAYNAADVAIGTCTIAPSGIASNWKNKFLGFNSTAGDIAKITIDGPFDVVDKLTFEPAVCTRTPNFGPSAITESFENIPISANNPQNYPSNGYSTPVTPFSFPSGIVLVEPNPNDFSKVVLSDFAKGSAGWGLCSGDAVSSSSEVPHGNAYLGMNNRVNSMVFTLPQPSSKVGLYVEGEGPQCSTLPITLTAYDASGGVVGSCSINATGLASNWKNNFLGVNSTSANIVKISLSGPYNVVDKITFEPAACTPVTWYQDSDKDGYGDAANTTESCTQPAGYVDNNTDCAPADGTAWRSATLYLDSDGDGYDAGTATVCYGETIPDGYGEATQGADCDDEDATVNPGVAPAITAPAAVPNALTSNNGSGDCSTTVALGTPTTNQNCSDHNVQAFIGSTEIDPATHLFGVGTVTVTWKVTDGQGRTATASQQVTVSDDELPVITHNGNKTLGNDAATCGAAVHASAFAQDNCSVGTPNGSRSDGLALNADYPVGTTTITWTVSDANGNAAQAVTQTITVTNADPVLGLITAPSAPVALGTAVSVSVPFTDNNASSAVIDWGNGTTATAQINTTDGVVTGSYTYPATGVHTVRVTLTDACGRTATAEYRYVVIYDPSAGFITGGGWINSPAGAYPAEPLLEGKASFGFVSKYQKGQKTPSGNTQFEFHAGGFNFKSTSYEWLVISLYKGQFKGEGTVNGTGLYGFLLSAIDGQITGGGGVDRFRIKIWNKTSGAVVYDNQITDAETADASTAISGGSIVIHTPSKGSVIQTASATERQELAFSGKLTLTALPNPSWGAFTLRTQSSSVQPLQVRMLDLLGRVVETRSNVAPSTHITFGSGYRPGVYFVEVVQGAEKQTIKLIKN